jgi:hypothetical protein
MGDRAESHHFEVIRGISKNSKKEKKIREIKKLEENKNYKYFYDFFFKNSFFLNN